jgi:hypothetical protein
MSSEFNIVLEEPVLQAEMEHFVKFRSIGFMVHKL